MSVIEDTLQDLLANTDPGKRINIAYSGGVDSTVLLHAVCQICDPEKHEVRAIHINHQIHSDAHQWEQHCLQQSQMLNVNYQSIEVDITPHRASGIEGAARQARYQAFTNLLVECDVLLMAHHADDQIETVMLQLFRGTGLHGLAGCAPSRQLGKAVLIRPFINISRQQIEDYANEKNLDWLHDPSNDSITHDRNYLRHQILPLLHSRWQGLRETIGRTSHWQNESVEILDDIAREDFGGASHSEPLSLDRISSMNESRLKNLLRWWIRKNGYLVPSSDVQQRILNDVIFSRGDCEALVQWNECEIRKYRDNVYIQPQMPPHDPDVCYQWEISEPLFLPSLNMTLTRQDLEQAGLLLNKINSLSVKFRVGGEVIKPRGRGCSKDLKTLFQESGVVPWERNRIPLIFYRDQLIYVWDYWISEGY